MQDEDLARLEIKVEPQLKERFREGFKSLGITGGEFLEYLLDSAKSRRGKPFPQLSRIRALDAAFRVRKEREVLLRLFVAPPHGNGYYANKPKTKDRLRAGRELLRRLLSGQPSVPSLHPYFDQLVVDGENYLKAAQSGVPVNPPPPVAAPEPPAPVAAKPPTPLTKMVRLKGQPDLLLYALDQQDDKVRCFWFAGAERREDVFPESLLEDVVEEAPKPEEEADDYEDMIVEELG